jgi:hypothetical protein
MALSKKDRYLIEKVTPCYTESEAKRILKRKGLAWAFYYKTNKHTFLFTNGITGIAIWFRSCRILETYE